MVHLTKVDRNPTTWEAMVPKRSSKKRRKTALIVSLCTNLGLLGIFKYLMFFQNNVNTVLEMADLITALRAYEANLTAQENFVRMAERALRILQ